MATQSLDFHRDGAEIISGAVAASTLETIMPVFVAGVGDILAMSLLTLHKSERSTQILRRRVLHVDYSADELPHPLVWHLD